MKIDEIILENGVATYAEGRTIMSETGLAANTEIEFVDTQSRWTGTGYKNSLYRIAKTNDLLVIRHNDGPIDNIRWDNVEILKDHFAQKRSYGQRVGKLSKRYGLPFEVCLALGDDEGIYPWFIEITEDLKEISRETLNDLYAGIQRRKSGLFKTLGEDLYNALSINDMGQINSERIANYVASKC